MRGECFTMISKYKCMHSLGQMAAILLTRRDLGLSSACDDAPGRVPPKTKQKTIYFIAHDLMRVIKKGNTRIRII